MKAKLIPPTDDHNAYGCPACQKDHTRITAMIDATCPKYALVPWAENTGRQSVVQLIKEGVQVDALSDQGLKDVIKQRGLNADAQKQSGANRGTAVHNYLSSYIESGRVPDPTTFASEYHDYLSQLAHFLIDYEPEFTESEFMVVNHELDYAGRCDGICVIGKQPPRRNKPHNLMGKTVLFDLKTNKDGRVYPPGHLYQVAGYELARLSEGDDPTEHQVVVAVGTSTYQLKVSTYEPESFRYLAEFYNDQQKQKEKVT